MGKDRTLIRKIKEGIYQCVICSEGSGATEDEALDNCICDQLECPTCLGYHSGSCKLS